MTVNEKDIFFISTIYLFHQIFSSLLAINKTYSFSTLVRLELSTVCPSEVPTVGPACRHQSLLTMIHTCHDHESGHNSGLPLFAVPPIAFIGEMDDEGT